MTPRARRLAELAADTDDGAPTPTRPPQMRPCQHCSELVEVEDGLAVDEHHRRGRCAIRVRLEQGHAAAVTEAQYLTGATPFDLRF